MDFTGLFYILHSHFLWGAAVGNFSTLAMRTTKSEGLWEEPMTTVEFYTSPWLLEEWAAQPAPCQRRCTPGPWWIGSHMQSSVASLLACHANALSWHHYNMLEITSIKKAKWLIIPRRNYFTFSTFSPCNFQLLSRVILCILTFTSIFRYHPIQKKMLWKKLLT